MVAILGANSVSGGYEVSNSLRFNKGDSPQLNLQNVGTVTNDKKFTFSTWLKRSEIGTSNYSILSADSGNNKAQILFRSGSDNAIRILETSDAFSSFDTLLTTDAVYRDPSAWYNIIIAYDSTDSTAGDRVKIYSNGVLQTLTGTTANLNHTTPFNEASYNLDIGHFGGSSGEFFDGYITETHFIDGTTKAPTDFGEFNDNGVWVPIKYTGVYGNNGFFLEFKQTGTGTDASGIGADTSGNNRHWAVSNLAATDITEDTCTNNFCTWNPLVGAKSGGSSLYYPTTSEGNLKIADGNAAHNLIGASTISFTQGKFYAEFKLDSTGDTGSSTGFGTIRGLDNHQNAQYDAGFTNSYLSTGLVFTGASSADSGVTFTTTDTIGVAVDCDNGYIYYHKNGTYINSGNPASGSSGTGGSALVTSSDEEYFFHCMDSRNANRVTLSANFGNPYYAISSGNTDGKYGNFEYAVPSGYYALCTKRLAEFG